MKYQEIKDKAKKKVQAKLAFYICTIVFTCTSVILLMLSFYLPSIAIWLKLPIPVFMMVLAILYLTAFGLPFERQFSDDWQEDAVEKEMVKLYKRKKTELPPLESLSEKDFFELKELERLEEKWDLEDDYL